jgi:hypothetical protein
MKTILKLLPALLLAACASPQKTLRQQTSRDFSPDKKTASVLFIGNSYSFNVPGKLKEVAAENGTDLRIKQITYGGWTLAQHVASGEASRAIRDGRWNFVVIQEQSLIPANTFKRGREMFPNVRTLANEARAAGAVPVLYQTWGHQHGNPRLSAKDDFKAMNQRVREGYREASKYAGRLLVVPAGDAWEKEAAAGRLNLLFMPDGSHPSPYGDRITAETFYRTLFHP